MTSLKRPGLPKEGSPSSNLRRRPTSSSLSQTIWKTVLDRRWAICVAIIIPILGFSNLAFRTVPWSEARPDDVSILNSGPPPIYFFLPTPTPDAESTPAPVAAATPQPQIAEAVAELPAQPAVIPVEAVDVSTPLDPASDAAIEHVVIISIDGLRPDALALAPSPRLDELIKRGAYSPEAQTVSMSVTLPSHASMLSGMTPDKHGIHWNRPYIGWPGMNGPTLFNVAHDAGLSTALVFGKHKLTYLVLGDSADRLFNPNTHDPEVKEAALEYIQEEMPQVLFIHFPDVDIVGHEFGWMSENQFFSITYVDGLIGEVVDEIERGGYLDNTLLIITADHGGHGFSHGDDTPEDRTIPWLAVGPGVGQGVILNTPINTCDTAATAIYALNLPIPENWDGKPIVEIFKKAEPVYQAESK